MIRTTPTGSTCTPATGQDVQLLRVDDLRVTARTAAGDYPAVRRISFDLERSNSLALVGESGSGKTLTVLAVAGLLGAGLSAEGSIQLDGRELTGMAWKRRRPLAGRQIGFIFQEPMSALHPVLPVGVQIGEGLRAHFPMSRKQRQDRVRELLDLVGLGSRDVAGHRIDQLSGGMRQRVMIAMAISCEPQLLIADEPTTALDVTLQRQVMDLLVSLRERMGLSLLLITHDLGVVAETCENAAVMYAGQIVERASTTMVLGDARHPYTQALVESIPRLGDTRRRLPTLKETAPLLVDTRTSPPSTGPTGHVVEVRPGHWVLSTEGS